MGRNEIRLRRQMMSAGNIARHRNYVALMERHERNQKVKRMARLFIYFLLIAFLVIIFIIVLRWEHRQEIKEKASPDLSQQAETIKRDSSIIPFPMSEDTTS